ncbi:MAG: hypothetical protein ACLTSX_02345 [Collinsella sp.]
MFGGYGTCSLMGVGGTWDELMQLEYLMNKFGDKVPLIHAAEWNDGPQKAHDRALSVITLTASSRRTTPGSSRPARGEMKEMGIRVFAMTKPEGLIGQAVSQNCVAMAPIMVPAAARRATISPTASACAC